MFEWIKKSFTTPPKSIEEKPKVYMRVPDINLDRWEDEGRYESGKKNIVVHADGVQYNVSMEKSAGMLSPYSSITVIFTIDEVKFVVNERKHLQTSYHDSYRGYRDTVKHCLTMSVDGVEVYNGDGEMKQDGVGTPLINHLTQAMAVAMVKFEKAVLEHEMDYLAREEWKIRYQEASNRMRLLKAEEKMRERHIKERL